MSEGTTRRRRPRGAHAAPLRPLLLTRAVTELAGSKVAAAASRTSPVARQVGGAGIAGNANWEQGQRRAQQSRRRMRWGLLCAQRPAARPEHMHPPLTGCEALDARQLLQDAAPAAGDGLRGGGGGRVRSFRSPGSAPARCGERPRPFAGVSSAAAPRGKPAHQRAHSCHPAPPISPPPPAHLVRRERARQAGVGLQRGQQLHARRLFDAAQLGGRGPRSREAVELLLAERRRAQRALACRRVCVWVKGGELVGEAEAEGVVESSAGPLCTARRRAQWPSRKARSAFASRASEERGKGARSRGTHPAAAPPKRARAPRAGPRDSRAPRPPPAAARRAQAA